MRNYELSCLVSLNASIEDIQKKIEEYLTEQEASLINLKNSSKRSLPNFIKTKNHPKTNIVNLLTFSFKLSPNKIKDVENKIKLDKEILRCSVLEKKAKTIPTRRNLRQSSKGKEIKQEKVKLENINEKLDEILDDI